jgi:ribonuclease J
MNVEINILGGFNTIGGNCVVIEDKKFGKTLLFDYGVNFSTLFKYFPFYYYKEKRPQINELLTLECLPKLDEFKEKIDLCCFSHIHGDHFHSRYSFEALKLYFSDRQEEVKPIFEPIAYKIVSKENSYIKNYLKENSLTRKELGIPHYYLPSDKLLLFPVSHSSPAVSILYESSEGVILYTGDFRLHRNTLVDPKKCENCERKNECGDYFFVQQRFSLFKIGRKLKESGRKIKVLICEGTNLTRAVVPLDAKEIGRLLKKILTKIRGLTIICRSEKDLENFLVILDILERIEKKFNIEKKVIISNRIRKFLSIISDSAKYFESFENVKEDIEKNPEKYVLIISTYEALDLLRGEGEFEGFKLPKGSVFILDNSEPLNESSEINEEELMRWLRFYKIPVYRIHSSGHVYPHDLKELLEVLKPEILIPIHTENPYAFESILPEETKLVVGRKIVINEKKIEVKK